MSARGLIVNADDLGQSPGVNRGIARAHEHGIVTSASMLVRFPAAAQAAAWARRHLDLSVGLHFDLGEWVFRDGEWEPLYAAEGPPAVELHRQLEQFRRLLDRDPTHLDSHQHVHLEEPVRSLLLELGERLGVPVRRLAGGVRYCGDFYGQDGRGHAYPELISPEALIGIVRALPPGLHELGCHPGEADGLASSYRAEREAELETLCDPRVRAVLVEEGIDLLSYLEVAARAVVHPRDSD